MEWARAKSIILFLLVVFNIYLLTNIYGYVSGHGIAAETIRNTEKIMESRGIRLECPIPEYNSDTPKLVVDNKGPDRLLLAGRLLGEGYEEGRAGGTYINGGKKLSFDSNGVLTYTDDSPAASVDVGRKNAVEKYTRDFLIDKGLADSSYILDEKKINSDGSIYLRYLEKYKGFPVYDNYTEVTVTQKGITYIEMQRRHIICLSSTRIDGITTAYQVLLGNFDGSESVTITGIDIGYKDNGIQDMDGIESSEQLPAWRVIIKDAARPRYFSAVDGREIK
jgi:regulatory protein YycI of two-component signal transduction system YycFG